MGAQMFVPLFSVQVRGGVKMSDINIGDSVELLVDKPLGLTSSFIQKGTVGIVHDKTCPLPNHVNSDYYVYVRFNFSGLCWEICLSELEVKKI
jgi:hypothetical protein